MYPSCAIPSHTQSQSNGEAEGKLRAAATNPNAQLAMVLEDLQASQSLVDEAQLGLQRMEEKRAGAEAGRNARAAGGKGAGKQQPPPGLAPAQQLPSLAATAAPPG